MGLGLYRERVKGIGLGFRVEREDPRPAWFRLVARHGCRRRATIPGAFPRLIPPGCRRQSIVPVFARPVERRRLAPALAVLSSGMDVGHPYHVTVLGHLDVDI